MRPDPLTNERREPAGEPATGDPGTWVDRHGDCLYRYALLRLRDREVAADLVQETFLHALRCLGSFDGRSGERTWLVAILKHKVVDHLRGVGRRGAAMEALKAGEAARSEFDARGRWRVGPAAWPGDPGREIEAGEFREVFGRCLAKLPRGLADAFFLREVDGLGPDDVQHALGITPANLWARLHRARSQLRLCLEAHWFGRSAAPVPRSPAPTPDGKARPDDGPTL